VRFKAVLAIGDNRRLHIEVDLMKLFDKLLFLRGYKLMTLLQHEKLGWNATTADIKQWEEWDVQAAAREEGSGWCVQGTVGHVCSCIERKDKCEGYS